MRAVSPHQTQTQPAVFLNGGTIPTMPRPGLRPIVPPAMGLLSFAFAPSLHVPLAFLLPLLLKGRRQRHRRSALLLHHQRLGLPLGVFRAWWRRSSGRGRRPFSSKRARDGGNGGNGKRGASIRLTLQPFKRISCLCQKSIVLTQAATPL